MSSVKAWWRGNLGERFWLEATDRSDLGADLRAPLADESGENNWRYTLFLEAKVGDLVFHYDKRRAAITSVSTIGGSARPGQIVWAARGSYARERGAEPVERTGYTMPLLHTLDLAEPVTLADLRNASRAIRDVHDRLKARVKGPLYFPFELSGRPIRPLQGYAFKLPADFVDLFEALRERARPDMVRPHGPSPLLEAPGHVMRSPEEAGDRRESLISSKPLDSAFPLSSRLTYMVEMLEILRSAQGALRSSEVYDRLLDGGHARQSDVELVQLSGETRFAKEVRFARLELVEAGLLQHSEDGVWSLSDLGWATFLTVAQARSLISRRRHKSGGAAKQLRTPGPTTGLVPSAYAAIVTRTLSKASWTYVLRYGETDLWKIGHAEDVSGRLADVNRHLPTEIIATNWRLHARHPAPDSAGAYDMEQRLLTTLSTYRTRGERVQCADEILIDAWRDCLPALS